MPPDNSAFALPPPGGNPVAAAAQAAVGPQPSLADVDPGLAGREVGLGGAKHQANPQLDATGAAAAEAQNIDLVMGSDGKVDLTATAQKALIRLGAEESRLRAQIAKDPTTASLYEKDFTRIETAKQHYTNMISLGTQREDTADFRKAEARKSNADAARLETENKTRAANGGLSYDESLKSAEFMQSVVHQALANKIAAGQLKLQEATAAASETNNRLTTMLAADRIGVDQRGQDVGMRNQDITTAEGLTRATVTAQDAAMKDFKPAWQQAAEQQMVGEMRGWTPGNRNAPRAPLAGPPAPGSADANSPANNPYAPNGVRDKIAQNIYRMFGGYLAGQNSPLLDQGASISQLAPQPKQVPVMTRQDVAKAWTPTFGPGGSYQPTGPAAAQDAAAQAAQAPVSADILARARAAAAAAAAAQAAGQPQGMIPQFPMMGPQAV
jgi:hypothetical protein